MLYRLSYIAPILVALAIPGVAFAGSNGDCPVSSAAANNALPTPATNNHTTGTLTIYLNGRGATLTAGYDDSGENSSSLVYARGVQSIRAPAFRGSTTTWNRVVQCVRDGLADYDIDVVDTRPTDDVYIMMMIGGSPSMLGYSRSASGVAPYNGSVIDQAVGYVFADRLRNRADSVCESTLHEVGHTLGLDHVYYCPDYMSYLDGCGEKSFTERDVSCGEHGERTCASGGDTQNSHQQLVDAVGLRQQDGSAGEDDSSRPDFLPDPDTDTEADTEADTEFGWGIGAQPESENPAGAVDQRAPSLTILSPEAGETYDANQYVYIALWAEDHAGVSNVELAWASSEKQYLFQCSAMPADVPAKCMREGNYYVFALLVGAGERAFAVRVTDREGNQTTSQPTLLRFSR